MGSFLPKMNFVQFTYIIFPMFVILHARYSFNFTVSIGLIWDSDRPNLDYIKDVVRCIGTTIRLPDVSIFGILCLNLNLIYDWKTNANKV